MTSRRGLFLLGLATLLGLTAARSFGGQDSGPLDLLKQRGLISAGRYFIVASEAPFRQQVEQMRPVMNELALKYTKLVAILENEGAILDLLDAITLMQGHVNDLSNDIARLPRRNALERMEAANWAQELNRQQSVLAACRYELGQRQRRVPSMGTKERAESEFNKVRDKFLSKVSEANPLYDKVKQDYAALQTDVSVKNAITAHSQEMKATFKLGPSDKLQKDARDIMRYEREYSPETATNQGKRKRATYQPKKKR
jgi:hypothetical protein